MQYYYRLTEDEQIWRDNCDVGVRVSGWLMILLLMKLIRRVDEASSGMKLGAGQGTYQWLGKDALKSMKVNWLKHDFSHSHSCCLDFASLCFLF